MIEIKNLNPTIGKFELQCTIQRMDNRAVDGLRRMCYGGGYSCVRDDYQYKRNDGGLLITHWKDWQRRETIIKVSEIDLPRLLGSQARLELTDLTPEMLKKGEEALIQELERLGIMQFDRPFRWRMNKMMLIQDFYTKEDPNLMMKLVRYHIWMRDGENLNTKLKLKNSRMESIRFGNDRYILANIDRKISALQRMMANVSKEDMLTAQHLMRYGIVFGRREISQLESYYPNLREIGLNGCLRDGFVSEYLSEMKKIIPNLMKMETSRYFGNNPWGSTDTVLKKMQDLKEDGRLQVDEDVWELMNRYLEMIEQEEPKALRNEFDAGASYAKKMLDELMWRMGLNATVIPNGILEQEEQQHLPYPSLSARIRTEEQQEDER